MEKKSFLLLCMTVTAAVSQPPAFAESQYTDSLSYRRTLPLFSYPAPQGQSEADFIAEVRRAVPDFDGTISRAEWKTYLKEQIDGISNADRLRYNHNKRDVSGVVAIFNGFARWKADRIAAIRNDDRWTFIDATKDLSAYVYYAPQSIKRVSSRGARNLVSVWVRTDHLSQSASTPQVLTSTLLDCRQRTYIEAESIGYSQDGSIAFNNKASPERAEVKSVPPGTIPERLLAAVCR